MKIWKDWVIGLSSGIELAEFARHWNMIMQVPDAKFAFIFIMVILILVTIFTVMLVEYCYSLNGIAENDDETSGSF